MYLKNVFNDFCTELSKRTGFLSEDNIRFYWFASMLKQDSDLNHYSLEEPYISLADKELDLVYEDNNEILAIEIKFHRNPSKIPFPHPNSAGTIFDDIQRLPLWKRAGAKKTIRYFFLYVTDEEMHKYLSNPAPAQNPIYRGELRKFYDSLIGKKVGTLNFGLVGVSDTPKSFFDKACESCIANVSPSTGDLLFSGISIIEKRGPLVCGSSSLQTKEYWVRLYEILQSNNVSAQEIVE